MGRHVFTFRAKSFVKIVDPIAQATGHSKYACDAQAKSFPVELEDWLSINPLDDNGFIIMAMYIKYDHQTETVTVELNDFAKRKNFADWQTLDGLFYSIKKRTLADDIYVSLKITAGSETIV